MGKTLFWLYVIAVVMGLLACESTPKTTEGTAQGSATEVTTAAAAPDARVLGFLRWYKANETAIGAIQMVKQVEGTPYEVSETGTEEYLAKLKSSGFISDVYLDAERAEFKELAQLFKDEPQTDGPPTGFDYDRVLHAQDWNDLDQAKVLDKKETGDKAEVTVDIAAPLRFSLTKTGNNWMIDKITNPGLGE